MQNIPLFSKGDLKNGDTQWNYGKCQEVDVQKLEKDLDGVIVKGEEVKFAFKVIRDYFVFTTRRLVLVDKKGMTGKKVE